MAEHRNTTITVRMVLKACAQAGVDTDELLRVSEIERVVAEHPDGEVTFNQMRNFWQNAFRLSGNPFLGMSTAQQVEIGDYKCIDYLTLNAATLGDSMENFCRYMILLNTWIGWEIDKQADRVILRMLPNAGVIPPHSYEFVFSIYIKRARQVTRDDWAPGRIRFPFPAPSDLQPHQDYFQCTVEYDAPAGEIEIDTDSWNQTLPNSDLQLLKVMDEHARLLMSQRLLPDDFVGQVRQQIVRALHGGDAQRDTIAKQLNMSPRTLQRRLEENGIAFVELLDEVRTELARNKLQNSDLSLAEIGFLLGFSEQSSFNRAFKRWTGKTPKEYRRDNSVG
ncbi:MAG: AraC family transcriptional regulator [Gammaproteobacteria bacterium]|nr:AraC family transcriptional regulator [Gammaproteobacteria bacterium]MDH5650543.1 AraC family transcriptional regulator [Gammaproteobacteria bacterium]